MTDLHILTDQNRYRDWCKNVPDLPIFMQDWWLDEVCQEGSWSAVLIEDKNGAIKAALPFQLKKYYGQTVVLPPILTPYLGPWIAVEEDDNRSYLKEKSIYWKLMDLVAEGLPSTAIFAGQWLPEVQDWLPFKWRGFQQTTRYTFILEDISDSQACFEAFKGSTRTNIRKAEAQLRVIQTEDADLFYQVHQKSFIRQGTESPLSQTVLTKLYQAAGARGQAEIRLAIDEKEQVHAGVLTVHDAHKVYVLISGVDADLGNKGALHLLYWEVIKHYSGRVPQLDFEGSMLPNVAPVFLSFGTRQVPYLRIFKFRNKWVEIVARLLNKVI